MDSSKPYVRLSVAQDISEASNPQQHYLAVSTSSSSLSGSLPIRARLTLDNDSDSEINSGHELGYVTSSTNISETGFLSGDEFATASERPFVAAELGEESSYELFWPTVPDPDEYEGVVGEVKVRPIANVSWESDGSDVVDEEIEEEVSEDEGGGLLGHVKALVSGFVDQVSLPPRVKVSEIEEEEEEEENDESLVVDCVEDCGYATAQCGEMNSVELNHLNVNVLEDGKKDEYVEEESFVHESFEKLEEIDVEGNKNQRIESSYISEAQEDKVECNASFNSITPRCVLGENIEDQIVNVKGLVFNGVQFQGSEAKVEVPLKEKDCTIEQDPTNLGLFVDSVPHEIKVFEVENEEELVMGKDSNSFVKESEAATEVESVEKSDLGAIVKWTEGNGLSGVGTKDPENLEETKSTADESIMHCPKRKTSDADTSRSSGTLDSGVSSECDFDVEGSGSQIMDVNTYSQPNPVLKIICFGKRNLSEAAMCDEYVLCSDFLESITPNCSVTHEHIFGGETKVRNCKIGRRFAGVTITHFGEDPTSGLKIEDEIAIGKVLVLAGSAGAVQCQGDTACGAKLELCLKGKSFPIKQDQTSLGLSLMKWGGGLVLTSDILSRFSVGNSKIAVHVVLDNKQRGKVAIRMDTIQSAGIIGILLIAVSVFGFFRSRLSVQNSR